MVVVVLVAQNLISRRTEYITPVLLYLFQVMYTIVVFLVF